MPHDFEPTEVAQSGDYTIKARQKVGAEVQASETYQVTSEGRPLGDGGELSGIAKRDLSEIYGELTQQVNVTQGIARQRMLEIQQDLQSRLVSEPQNKDRIEQQLSFVERKLSMAFSPMSPCSPPAKGKRPGADAQLAFSYRLAPT